MGLAILSLIFVVDNCPLSVRTLFSVKKKDGVPTPGWGAVAATSEGVEASQGLVHKCREGGDFIFQERQVDAMSAE